MSVRERVRPVHRERFVSASELGEYAYCRRAWWLRAVRGAASDVASARYREGHDAHERHGWSLLLARALALAAAMLALAGIAALSWHYR
ncbi:MAG: hypothetical protein ABJD07_17510 [Gemmatimonadaceae bacterium]